MHPSPPIGCTKADLDTPALCLDLDVMEANIARIVTWRYKDRREGSAPRAPRQELSAQQAGLQRQDWGMTELTVIDPFGNRITFGEPTAKANVTETNRDARTA